MIELFHGDSYGNLRKTLDNETGNMIPAAKLNLYHGGTAPP
jgi:hypothetical protein